MGEDEMNAKEEKELALSKIVLIVLVVLGLCAMIWLAWFAPDTKKGIIDSYKACTEAGNPIQENYPSVCVTKDGKRFVNPDDRVAQ